jgi:hypothetical protein
MWWFEGEENDEQVCLGVGSRRGSASKCTKKRVEFVMDAASG